MSVSKIRFGIYALFVVFSFPSLKTKITPTLESALIISHCTEYSALSLISPAVVLVLLGFLFVFVLCPLQQFEMISKAPDLKKKMREEKPCQKCLLLML